MTMTAPDVAAAIESEQVVAIVRIDDAREASDAARALVAGGIRVLEFSLAAACSLDAIEAVRDLSGEAIVGAGTVLTVADAQAAVDAGAQYLVAPVVDAELLAWSRTAGVLHIPGAFSPTEIFAASRAGAQLIKLFPAARLGPRYVADVLGPLPHLRLIPTGGIDETNTAEFLNAGAAAVAIGSSLAQAGRTQDQTTQRARQITDLISRLRRDP
jgi:2-dehydro-3-deoxyphosphogluconate aldolase/(4S)-4-hydroxy-2-oxoglutarate aldolase